MFLHRVKNMTHQIANKYLRLIETSGIDGMDPTAKAFLAVGLEHLKINSSSTNDTLAKLSMVSMEAISMENIKAFVMKVINYILNAYKEWKDSIKRKVSNLRDSFEVKYRDWEMDNVSFGDTEPVTIKVTNPYLARGDEPLLKSNGVYTYSDLVPGGNYRKFQIANGVMSLTGIGKALVKGLQGEDDYYLSPEHRLSDLIGELSELGQPLPEDNFGGWGLSGYDREEIKSLADKSFKEIYESLMKIRFVVGGVGESYDLTVSDPADCIASIKAIKKQLETVDEILTGYKYFDVLEERIKTARAFFSSKSEDEYTEEFKLALDTFNQSADLFKKYAEINVQLITGISKSLIAAGDVYNSVYKKFRSQTK